MTWHWERILELLETQKRLRGELQSSVEKLVATTNRITDHRNAMSLDKQIALAHQLAATLTSRQRQILMRIVAGEANKTVAFDLGLSTKTVETHRKRVMRKLNATSFADLVRMAMLAGLAAITPKNATRH